MTPSSKSDPELETQPAPIDADGAEVSAPEAAAPEGPAAAAAPEVAAEAAPEVADEAAPEAEDRKADNHEGQKDVQTANQDEDENHEDGDGEDFEDEDTAEYDEILGSEAPNRYPTVVPLIGALLGLTAIAALMVVAFALPVIKSGPDRLPIGVSGTATFQDQVRQVLTQEGPKPFLITTYSSESKLRSAI